MQTTVIRNSNSRLGIITYWTLGNSSLPRLREGFSKLGLESYVPEQTAPMPALRAAMEATFRKKLIRPLRGRGFTVVTEERGEEENKYETSAAVTLDEEDMPLCNMRCSTSEAAEIREHYITARQTLSPASGGIMLSKLATSLIAGVTLRKTGGIYWFPGDKESVWSSIAKVVESSCIQRLGELPTCVYTIRHGLDPESIRAVRDALLAELAREQARITREMQKAGDRAKETLLAEAEQLMAKMKRYEAILGEAVAGVSAGLAEVETEAATAILAADDFGGIGHVA